MKIQCFKAKLNQNNEKKNSYRRQYIRPAFLNYCSLWLSSDFLVESAYKCKHRDRLSQVMDDCLSVLFFCEFEVICFGCVGTRRETMWQCTL